MEESDVSKWRWVPSSQNVADEGKKWSGSSDLSNESRWFTSTPFLSNEENLWPIFEFAKCNVRENVIVHHIAEKTEFIFSSIMPDISRFSKWEKLLRCQMMILKFIAKILNINKLNNDFKTFIESPLIDSANKSI